MRLLNAAPSDGGTGGGTGSGSPPAGTGAPAAGGTPPAGGGAPPTILGAPTPPVSEAVATGKWQDSAPEEWKTDPAFSPYLGFETQKEAMAAMGKSLKDTKGWVGKKFELPTDKSTPEEVADFKKRMGAPLKPDDYGETVRPETIPAEQWDKETDAEVKTLAHKHHMTPAAVKDFMDLYGRKTAAGVEAYTAGEVAHVQRETQSLREEWKDKFDDNVGLAKRFAETIGLKPDDPIFTNANAVRAMVRGAKLIAESSLVPGAPAGVMGNNKTRANAIMDPKNNELIARQYRGEMGAAEAAAAQDVVNQLLSSGH